MPQVKKTSNFFPDAKTLILYVAFVSGGMLYTHFHRQHNVDFAPIVKMIPQIDKSEYEHYLQARKVLLQAMTPTEKEEYSIANEKIRRNSATNQDLEDLGLLYDRVIRRLKEPGKTMVKTFFAISLKKYGDQAQRELNL